MNVLRKSNMRTRSGLVTALRRGAHKGPKGVLLRARATGIQGLTGNLTVSVSGITGCLTLTELGIDTDITFGERRNAAVTITSVTGESISRFCGTWSTFPGEVVARAGFEIPGYGASVSREFLHALWNVLSEVG